MSYQSKFADELRTVMAKKHISQATVARLTSLNSGTVSRIMTGKRKVSYDTIAKVAEKLDMWKGLTPYDLANKVDELNKQNKNLFIIFIIQAILILGVLVWLKMK